MALKVRTYVNLSPSYINIVEWDADAARVTDLVYACLSTHYTLV